MTRGPRKGPETKRATPGGYGGKPPGVAFIGVPTGARNAGSGTPTGDQGTDMNGTRRAPPMCQDLISTESQELTVVTRLTRSGNAFAHLTYSRDDLAFIFRVGTGAGAGVGGRAERRPPRPVLEEPALVVRLAPAVGEDDRDVRDDDRADGRNQGKPAHVGEEQHHRDREADGPDAHHQQVPVLPVPDVLGQRPTRLGNQVHLL